MFAIIPCSRNKFLCYLHTTHSYLISKDDGKANDTFVTADLYSGLIHLFTDTKTVFKGIADCFVSYFVTFLVALAVAQDCTLCPNGNRPNRTKTVPFGNGIFTCGDLETVATRRDNDNEVCRLIQSYSAFCECPSTCTLCPSGSEVQDASRMVHGKTCGELQDEASISLDCSESRQYAAACCDGGACTSICPDGSSLSEDKVDAFVGIMSDGTIQTCGDIQARIANEQDSQRCHDYYQIGIHACGCNATFLPQPKCMLCENEGETPTNLLLNVGRGNLCFEFMACVPNRSPDKVSVPAR